MTSSRITIAALIGAVAIIAAAACQAPPAATTPAPDYEAENGPAFDAFIHVLNSKEYDKLEGVFAPDFRRVAPDQDANGAEEMEAFIRQIHDAYPDFRIVVGETLYGDGLSFAQWTVTGTATAEDGTESPIEVRGATMLRYAGGMITEEHVFFDSAALTSQVGGAEMPHAR